VITISEWYHTGDEELDKLLDRNADDIPAFVALLVSLLVERRYRQIAGVQPGWHILAAMAAKYGADNIGYWLSGIIDPDEGTAAWNRFHDRVYDWYGLEEYEVLGFGLGTFPNSLKLTEVIAESIVMIGSDVLGQAKETMSIFGRSLTGRFIDAPAINPFFLADQVIYYG